MMNILNGRSESKWKDQSVKLNYQISKEWKFSINTEAYILIVTYWSISNVWKKHYVPTEKIINFICSMRLKKMIWNNRFPLGCYLRLNAKLRLLKRFYPVMTNLFIKLFYFLVPNMFTNSKINWDSLMLMNHVHIILEPKLLQEKVHNIIGFIRHINYIRDKIWQISKRK